MNRKMVKTIVWGNFVLAAVLSAGCQIQAQDAKTPYPSIGPIDQYFITDRNAEIALARSAAPEAISRDATVLVLGRHGYETAVEGKNGFVCVVERAWIGPFRCSGVLEPQNSGSDLLQSAGRAIRFADYLQKNRDGVSRANEG